MKIVVLVKQVPHPEAIEFDEETKQLRREGVPLILNPFDRAAVLAAVGLREREGGEVVTLTMGPPQAKEALEETLALGADRCIHLNDPLFAVADTLGTARTLAFAVEKERADLIVAGRKTVDAETSQVPPELAAFLGWPQVTYAVELRVAGGRLHARRETDDGEETVEVELPAVVSVARAAEEPSGRAHGRIDVWTAADLVDDPQPNDKRFGQPGSPTRVLAVRDVSPERAGVRVADADAAIEAVRDRLAELEAPTSSWEKPSHIAEQPAATYDAWSVVETREGEPTRTSLELVARARELAGKLGGASVALFAGHRLEEAAKDVIRHGAESVYLVDDPRLSNYDSEQVAGALRQVVERERPHVLLIPASMRGRDYGPRLAASLQLGMTGDCVNVDIAKAGRLLQTKPAYGGNIVSVIMGSTTPQVATVRPRMFAPLEPRDVAGEVHRVVAADLPRRRTILLETTRESDAWRLDEADVVVLAGPDVDDAVDELARVARGTEAAIGGTREVCATGALPWRHHVGLFGRQVAPRVLVAVGVPGDFEHLTGFVKAAVVVAFGDGGWPADIVVSADWRSALPPLVEGVASAV